MEFQLRQRILFLIYGVVATLAIAVVVVLYQIGLIAHGSMYGYGLIFDYEWAIPYWTFERIAYVLLGCIAGVNGFLVAFTFLTHKELLHLKPSQTLQKQMPLRSKSALRNLSKETETMKAPTKAEKTALQSGDGVDIVALPIVCNNCGKVFTQPLCMFDFKSGKPRLVNVCPYCNTVLAVAGNSKWKNQD